jgi:hypothetical protein
MCFKVSGDALVNSLPLVALVSTQLARELKFKTPLSPVLRGEGPGVRGFSL